MGLFAFNRNRRTRSEPQTEPAEAPERLTPNPGAEPDPEPRDLQDEVKANSTDQPKTDSADKMADTTPNRENRAEDLGIRDATTDAERLDDEPPEGTGVTAPDERDGPKDRTEEHDPEAAENRDADELRHLTDAGEPKKRGRPRKPSS